MHNLWKSFRSFFDKTTYGARADRSAGINISSSSHGQLLREKIFSFNARGSPVRPF